MLDILLIVACLYMAYANISTLTQTPLAEWEPVHYVMVVLTVLLVAVGALKGWQYYKKKKAAAAENPEATEKGAPDALQPEAEEPQKAAKPVDEAASAPPRPELSVDVTGLEDWEIETADFNYTLVELPGDDKK